MDQRKDLVGHDLDKSVNYTQTNLSWTIIGTLVDSIDSKSSDFVDAFVDRRIIYIFFLDQHAMCQKSGEQIFDHVAFSRIETALKFSVTFGLLCWVDP
jgi:hypothetical protein